MADRKRVEIKHAVNNRNEKRDVKLQIFVTPTIDDKLGDLSDLMGLTKNELVRQAIAQMLFGYESSIGLIREQVEKGKL